MRYRLGLESDLEPALDMLKSDGAYRPGPAGWAPMLPAWQRWIEDDLLGFVVWEDETASADERLRGVGMTVVVSSAFADSVVQAGEPYPARRLYEAARDGRLGLPDRRAVALANAREGVDLFVLHNPLRIRDLHDPRQSQLLPLGPQAFYFCHAGYYVRTVLWEVYGEQHIDYLVGGGFELLSSYRRDHPEIVSVERALRPYLGGVRRPAVVERGYDPMRLWMFSRAVPRLGLTAAQQKMLRYALLGYTDRELSGLLGVSANALKQRWLGVFERFARNGPGRSSGAAARSIRRLHVLDYLRQNLHELRPYDPAGRSGAGG
jgi:DNA-binding CsgD family transcriptional regulator